MAYISTEEVKRIREGIKFVFKPVKGLKFSIRRRHSSTVVVEALKGPLKVDVGFHLNL